MARKAKTELKSAVPAAEPTIAEDPGFHDPYDKSWFDVNLFDQLIKWRDDQIQRDKIIDQIKAWMENR